jgi:hypothetical protein
LAVNVCGDAGAAAGAAVSAAFTLTDVINVALKTPASNKLFVLIMFQPLNNKVYKLLICYTKLCKSIYLTIKKIYTHSTSLT